MSNPASIWNPGLDLPIPAVNANDKIQTALIPVTSNGQTVFTLPFAYAIGVKSLEVFVQNNTTFKCRKLVLGEYTETTSTTITYATTPALTTTDYLIVTGFIAVTIVDAAGYTKPETDALLATKANTTALATYAPLASPSLTGTPTAPTQAPGDSTTAIASTQFTQQEINTAIATITPILVDSDFAILQGGAGSAGAGANLSCDVVAPVQVACPYSFSALSGLNTQVYGITSNVNVTLKENTTNYLFLDKDVSTDTVSVVSTPYPMILSKDVNDSGISEAALYHFEVGLGFNEYSFGTLLTAVGSAATSSLQAKFGTQSVLLNGSTDAIKFNQSYNFGRRTSWTIECFFRFAVLPTSGNTAAILALASGTNICELGIFNNAGVLKTRMFLSSNGTSADIVNAQLGTSTTWAINTWYHLALVFDGTQYVVYIDGVADNTKVSSTKIFSAQSFNLGARFTPAAASSLNGYIDELRISGYARYPGAFTPTAVAFAADDFWYATNGTEIKQILKYSNVGATQVKAVPIGEAVTNATIRTSYTPYNKGSVYVSPQNTISAAPTTITISHNLGWLSNFAVTATYTCIATDAGYTPDTKLYDLGTGSITVPTVVSYEKSRTAPTRQIVARYSSAGTLIAPHATTGVLTALTNASWKVYYTVRKI